MNSDGATRVRAKSATAMVLVSLTFLFAAGISRAADAGANQGEPVDLVGKYTIPVNSLTNINGFPAWKSAAVGHQVFRGVPLPDFGYRG